MVTGATPPAGGLSRTSSPARITADTSTMRWQASLTWRKRGHAADADHGGLDYFRDINASYGHEGATAASLKWCASSSCPPEGDILARFGGDEFTVLLPDTPGGTGREIAEQVRGDVESMDILEQYKGPVKN